MPEELYKLYLEGFSGDGEVFETIDIWMIDNQWELNDWLSEIIRKYIKE